MTKPVRITLDEITDKNYKHLRLLNKTIFDVKYPNSFYKDIYKQPDFTRLAFYGDILVGAVTCGFKNEIDDQLCILTLGVLAPYRRLGIGAKLVDYVINDFTKKHPEVHSIYLHVQEGNDSALAFYQKFGFEITGEDDNYYSQLDIKKAQNL
eukprot:TRINITY_DN14066_c0_g1_i1.p1 TRINITY_DN14066_c0_g1~~TRINITY_DN14066_c0_g1_i1.p1  ORF type:complete len:152 (-),score=15.18 TRINITY_DN14066_c0_g1_i1:315-770(-)